MVLPALLLVRSQMPDPSHVTHIPRIVASITSVWRVLLVSMVAPLALSSRLAIATVLATARIPKMFPAGKLATIFNLFTQY